MANAMITNMTPANAVFIAHASNSKRECKRRLCLFPIIDFVKQFVNNPTNAEVQNETFLVLNSHSCGRVWNSRYHGGGGAGLFASISKEGRAQGRRMVVHRCDTSSDAGRASRHDRCLVRWFQRGSIQRHGQRTRDAPDSVWCPTV